MSGRLDIDALRALQAIVACGGVTRASDVLSLSQSAVSHKIRRLEESIGCDLLSRRAGAPLLTESGHRLLAYADRILSLHDEAIRSLSTRPISGKVRLGMTEDMTSSGLARILGRFARLFPEVSVRSHVAQSLTLQDELKAGRIDIAVMQIFASDVRTRDIVLFNDSLVWAKSADLKLDCNQPIPFVAYDDNCFYKRWMLEKVALVQHNIETVLQCSSNAGIVTAVEAGLGVSILNQQHVSKSMDLLTDGFIQPPDIAYIVRVSSKSKTKAVAALAEEIESEAREFMALEAA
ncbi:MAG: LysR family transcriptional regulator [Hyphomicrobiaceae bacterium]